jgi:hypothetical protein
MDTLLLDQDDWDLVLDLYGNWAVASNPYSQAQDAASEIRTFQGEAYYDTTLGIPYWVSILGQNAPLSLVKSEMTKAALRVPGVTQARAFLYELRSRVLRGQVQITNAEGEASGVNF